MIIGVGIDVVECKRFEPWLTLQRPTLQKIFSPKELTYCFQNPWITTLRLAGRFAAKEAAYKAFSPLWQQQPSRFIPFAQQLEITTHFEGPVMHFNKKLFEKFTIKYDFNTLIMQLSLSHCKLTATAMVVIQKEHQCTLI